MLEGKWRSSILYQSCTDQIIFGLGDGKFLLDMSFHTDSTLLDTKKKLSLKYSAG